MSSWSVDAEGVAGVLAGVDSVGAEFESAHQKIVEAVESASMLSVEGRTVLSSAWDGFLAARSLVPGKVMHQVASAAAALSEATVSVVAGDAQMASDIDAAQRMADGWGIEIPAAYGTPDGRH